MKLAAIDYHLRTTDARLCAQAQGLGISALELTRPSFQGDRRWLSSAEGISRWYQSALAMGISLESYSATFAYEWPLIDRKGRVDLTSVDALADLVHSAAFLKIPLLHVPLLEAAAPKNPGDLRRYHQYLLPALEIAKQYHVQVSLETNWAADLSLSLAEMDKALSISFDPGNCIALGRNPLHELITLEHCLGQIRLRDRRRHEIFRSLPLGHGDVNWSELQQQLVKMSRRPQFVLAATGGAALLESYASAGRLLYQLINEPLFHKVA